MRTTSHVEDEWTRGPLARRAAVARRWRLFAPSLGFTIFIGAAASAEAAGHHLPSICLFRSLIGLPCPGCGVTHAVIQLLRGHVQSSWQIAPAASAVIAFFAATAIVAVLHSLEIVGEQAANKFRLRADRVFAGSLLIGWAVTIARHF